MTTPTASEMRRAIARKRDGTALERALWNAIVAGAVRGEIDEAQLGALLMACRFRGLDRDETEALTQAFVESGETLRPPVPNCVDKHSSGGVADTTSLVVVPLVAACGVAVAKLSGRALGHTGGTLDKLEAIEGVRTDLNPERFAAQVRTVGCAIAAQSERLVPADRYFYALRDRTATVESSGLVAASIASKKIAGGAPAIVYDVKVGRGAFFKNLDDAKALAEMLVALSAAWRQRATAIVSDMNEPLGTAIGTGLEVLEARAILRGERRVARLSDLCDRLSLAMLRAGGVEAEEAQRRIGCAVSNGEAYATFERMANAQGAASGALDALAPHPVATAVLAPRAGYVAGIDAPALGEAARALVERDGPGAGIHLGARIGDYVEPGRALATVYGSPDLSSGLELAFDVTTEAPASRPLIYLEIGSEATRSTLETR